MMLLFSLPAHAHETVRLGGTGSGLELLQQLGGLYARQHEGVAIAVIPSLGSSGGIKALQAGALDLAISARPAKPGEKGLVSVPLCRTPLAFVVHPANTVLSVRTEDLVQLYGIPDQTWPDGERVRVVLRPEAEADTKALRGISSAVDQAVSLARARPGMIKAVTDQENLKALQTTPGSLGMASLAMITAEHATVRTLFLNGVEPTLQNIEQGRYPLVREYYLIARSPAGKTVQRIIAFVRSSKGASLVKTLQCAPVEQR